MLLRLDLRLKQGEEFVLQTTFTLLHSFSELCVCPGNWRTLREVFQWRPWEDEVLLIPLPETGEDHGHSPEGGKSTQGLLPEPLHTSEMQRKNNHSPEMAGEGSVVVAGGAERGRKRRASTL